MFSTKSLEPSIELTDHAIKSTQRQASKALESLAHALVDLRQQAEPLLNLSSDQISKLYQRGSISMRATSRQLRQQAQRASDRTLNYIQDEPVKSVVIAAGIGAAIVALVSLISHSRDSD